jgi:flagellar motor switch protein FliN/FliY
MEFIHPEFIEALKAHQAKLAEQISQAMTEDPETPIVAEITDIGTVKTADLYADLGVPVLSLQFGFADVPEHPQVFIIHEEVSLALAAYLKGEPLETVDENLVSEIRTSLEAIVQGTCLGAGAIRSEPVVATNLQIRHAVFSFPPNLQKLDELIQVKVSLTGEEPIGTMVWLMDAEAAATIVVPSSERESDNTPFTQVDNGFGAGRGVEEPSGIELLMDIPLEISVELGRVRMLVKDVVELGTGSIVEIDKAAGEPVDVMVNGRVVAKGEVVVIEDNFGVRITEILTPQERLTRLGEVA